MGGYPRGTRVAGGGELEVMWGTGGPIGRPGWVLGGDSGTGDTGRTGRDRGGDRGAGLRTGRVISSLLGG